MRVYNEDEKNLNLVVQNAELVGARRETPPSSATCRPKFVSGHCSTKCNVEGQNAIGSETQQLTVIEAVSLLILLGYNPGGREYEKIWIACALQNENGGRQIKVICRLGDFASSQ